MAMSIRDFPFSSLKPEGTKRPYLPIQIINPHSDCSLRTYGLIDTGADECAFPAWIALELGHDLEKGDQKLLSTAGGAVKCYSHTTTIVLPNFTLENVVVDYIDELETSLLGVKSFLSEFILTINYPDQTFSIVQF